MKIKKWAVLFSMAAFIALHISPSENTIVKAASSARTEDGMVLVKGGTFTMGSPKSERLRGKDETAHKVTVSSFYAGPYEVTQKDYQAVMEKIQAGIKAAGTLSRM